MLSPCHWGQLCAGQGSELCRLAQNTNAAVTASKGPGAGVLATLQLTVLVLHLTPSSDCFWLTNVWLFFRWHLRLFLYETSFTTPKELLTIDIKPPPKHHNQKNPKQKKIHKTNDAVSHCDCWLIILEMIKHCGLLFGIHQKTSLDWRIPFLLGCNCSCPFLAYVLWFLIVEI